MRKWTLFLVIPIIGISLILLYKPQSPLAVDLPSNSSALDQPSIAQNQSDQATAAPKAVTPKAVAPKEYPKTLAAVLKEKGIKKPGAGLSILVDKSDHLLSLYWNGSWLISYHVELGDNGLGDKKVSGDHKTPEGHFYITEKSVLNPADPYLGSRWMRIGYPNTEDAERGLNQGLIDWQTRENIIQAFNNRQTPPQRTALGGGVGIHGGDASWQGQDWTWGCVGLSNSDIEEFYDYILIGTPLTIQP